MSGVLIFKIARTNGLKKVTDGTSIEITLSKYLKSNFKNPQKSIFHYEIWNFFDFFAVSTKFSRPGNQNQALKLI